VLLSFFDDPDAPGSSHGISAESPRISTPRGFVTGRLSASALALAGDLKRKNVVIDANLIGN
jgi:hypothetical protein